MANITTNLGPVSAYLDAVAHGYTGTREEFGEYLAHVGDNAAAAAASAQRAAASESAAAGSESAAAGSATAAAGSASAAGQQADNAAVSAATASTAATAAEDAETVAQTAQAAAESAQSAAEAAQEAAEAVLESIPEDYSELSADVSGLKSAFEDYGGIVAYWGADETLPVDDTYAKTRIGVSRGGAYLTLTGQTWKGSASDKIAIKLTGSLVRATTNTEINAFAADLNLKAGHTYVFTNRLVSGSWEPASSSITNLNVSLRVRDSSNNYTVTSGAMPVTPTAPVISETVTLDADKAVKVDLYIREGLTMSANTVVCCSITDITESIEADGVTRYLNDKIDALTVQEGSAWN